MIIESYLDLLRLKILEADDYRSLLGLYFFCYFI